MKSLFITLICFISLACVGQNNLPEIEIISIEVDDVSQELSLTYQLNDVDEDACEVWLKYSTDGGIYFETVALANVTGSVGDGISSGDNLNLLWDFSDLTSEISDVHIQLFASDNQSVDISEMVSEVDEAQLLSTLESIVGERHYAQAPDHLETVRNLITENFIMAGLQTEGHDFVYSSTDMRNIIGRKPGAKQEDITFIIDGHFDGVPGSPAADDNGSAVAGVLEALRILSQYNFEHSIRFIGFDAEELGLIGSQRYVQNGIKPFEDIQGVLNFEMIGFYSDEPNSQSLPAGFDLLFPEASQQIVDNEYRGDFLTVVGNVNSNSTITAFVQASGTYVPELSVISVAVPGNGTIAPDLRRSDHSRFWDAGYKALMLTDASEFRNYNYHTPGDVIETLDFNFMKNVVKATVAAAAELAVPISAAYAAADLSTILSVEDHNHEFPADVSIFPNPSNGLLSIEIANSSQGFKTRLEVFDLQGKQLYREILNIPTGTSKQTINLQALSAGSYILNLNTGEASVTNSFIIEK